MARQAANEQILISLSALDIQDVSSLKQNLKESFLIYRKWPVSMSREFPFLKGQYLKITTG